MNIIDISEARSNRHWKQGIKQGSTVFKLRKMLSRFNPADPRYREWFKKQMMYEIAHFLFENNVGLFHEIEKDVFELEINIFIGKRTTERLQDECNN